MPELEYFLVADSYSVDRDTNAMSLFNVLSEIQADKFPLLIPKLAAVSCWIASVEEIEQAADFQVVTQFVGAPNEELREFRANFTCDRRLIHVILEISGAVFVSPGLLKVELLLNGTPKAKHRVFLEQSDR